MQYRTLGTIDFAPSALGFGAMRLPTIAAADGVAGPGRIDEAAATAMLRRAVAAGVNYVDTAYVYHGGESEPWLGRALRAVAADLYGAGEAGLAELRSRVKVATKLPVWQVGSRDDPERLLDEQLARLQLDSIDSTCSTASAPAAGRAARARCADVGRSLKNEIVNFSIHRLQRQLPTTSSPIDLIGFLSSPQGKDTISRIEKENIEKINELAF